uniref:XK-related protein n=1 Tax=Pogona vitticeps TaxID=103695 RepID=A0A6J0V3V4_9SAUR|nr:XK-related protein 8 [Pogona vitticeps]
MAAWAPCGPSCSLPQPPRYCYLDLAFSFMGTVAFLADLGIDVWVAASYLKASDYYWGGLVLGLLVLSSLTTQFFSWAWYQSDPPDLRQELPTGWTLITLHVLQLGYLYRCLHALKVGFHVCRKEVATETQRAYAVFLSHDISLLRLFETFLESAPQLTLVLYIILNTSKAEIFQILGICTSFLCIAWGLLDYHQSLRSFLRDKDKLGFLSSVLYFLWNFLLVCPRILSLALFTVVFPRFIAFHFLAVWSVMFLWVTWQSTHFMERDTFEWTYRAMVAVILYFCWFNVAEGKTRHRSVIYHTFILLDNLILAVWWIWDNTPLSMDSHLVHLLLGSLFFYMLGILLRAIYYRYFHPTVQAASSGSYDEVDSQEIRNERPTAFRELVIVGQINPRTYRLSQNFFAVSLRRRQPQKNGTLGDINL